jgi:hypothetical protein
MTVNVRTRTIGLVLLSVVLAGAQITITPDEIPQTPGDTFTYKYTVTLSPVNVGTQGGPQVWDFDTASYVGNITACKLVDPAGTPLYPYYPLANIASLYAEGDSVQAYEYLSVSSTEYMDYGGGSVTPETTIFQVWDPPLLANPLPLNYGDQWQTDWAWCDTMDDLAISVHTWGHPVVDAWGTANTPAGSFDCLRVNSYDSTITMTWLNDTLINSDTFGLRVYRWQAENVAFLASATGAEDDTSLVFTESDCYRVLTDAAYGIAEQREVPGASSFQVSPNPFTGTTHLRFVTRQPGVGTVRIYDQAGNLVRALADGSRQVGLHSVVWNGTDAADNRVAPGVYFCTVSAGAAAGYRKLVLSD